MAQAQDGLASKGRKHHGSASATSSPKRLGGGSPFRFPVNFGGFAFLIVETLGNLLGVAFVVELQACYWCRFFFSEKRTDTNNLRREIGVGKSVSNQFAEP